MGACHLTVMAMEDTKGGAIHSRPPLGRMMRLHSLLQDNKFPNCSKLSEELEISVRTLKRDVAFMKIRLNLPIEYNESRHGYFYSRPVKSFPNVHASEADLFALLVAQKAISQYQGTELQKPLEGVFQKLAGQLDQRAAYTLGNLEEILSFRPFAPGDSDLEVFKVLIKALRERWIVTFDYKKLGVRQRQPRQVHPYHLACIENRWYLIAFDVDRSALRTFVLTRLHNVKLTDQKFPRPTNFKPDEYLRGSFKVFKGKEDYQVVIQFDAWATDLLRERKWHSSQQIEVQPDGSSRLRLRLNNLEEVEGWILSWGNHAKVLQPPELVVRLQRIISDLVKSYGPESNTEN